MGPGAGCARRCLAGLWVRGENMMRALPLLIALQIACHGATGPAADEGGCADEAPLQQHPDSSADATSTGGAPKPPCWLRSSARRSAEALQIIHGQHSFLGHPMWSRLRALRAQTGTWLTCWPLTESCSTRSPDKPQEDTGDNSSLQWLQGNRCLPSHTIHCLERWQTAPATPSWPPLPASSVQTGSQAHYPSLKTRRG